MTHHLDHPLIRDHLSRLRDVGCPPAEFRHHVGQIARLMVPGVTTDFALRTTEVMTPLETTEGHRLVRPLILVPILRAGLGLCEGFLDLLPKATVAHIGLARDEKTLEPATYYFKAPDHLAEAEVLVLDPMLATGGSAAECLNRLKAGGARHLRFVSLVASPEGIAHLGQVHPDVPVFTAAIDRELNGNGYILPGLGDAGDRIFGTV